MNKSKFKENFNFITNIVLILLLVFGGVIYADTNGIWTRAEDVRPGIFGSDEGGDGFEFTTQVNFTDEVNVNNINIRIICDENGNNCIQPDNIGPTGNGGGPNPPIVPGNLYTETQVLSETNLQTSPANSQFATNSLIYGDYALVASSSVIFGKITANSSPPKRPMRSVERRLLFKVSAKAISALSPKA